MSELSPKEVAVSPVEKFREFLATRQMRLTQEREIIVGAIFSDHEHFDCEEIVARLDKPQNGHRVSRATVYRTVAQMEEAGLIRKVARTNDRDVYEHDYGYPQHDHFICRKCNKLIEFSNEDVAELLEKVALELGFRMTGHRLEAHGMCAECAKPPSRRHKKLDMI